MEPQGLYLNHWTPDFKPAVDVLKEVPGWVRLPNLLIHCWNPSSLQNIGNIIGIFIDKADPKGQYSCAWIYVEFDLEDGIPEEIKLIVGEWKNYKKVYYEKLPFKCRNCNEYGNFQNHFPKTQVLQQEKDLGEGWQARENVQGKPKPKFQKRKGKKRGQIDMENSFVVLGGSRE
jgi:hypothetical protein